MLPGDVVWDFIKKTGKRLDYENGHVLTKGAEGFQCKDCKYYILPCTPSSIKSNFTPEMSSAFVVKIGNGTEDLRRNEESCKVTTIWSRNKKNRRPRRF